MDQVKISQAWGKHNKVFADLGREIPWAARFRLWGYYLLLDRESAKPIKRVFKLLTDLAYVAYFLGKCMFFSILARRFQFPAGKTLVLLTPGASSSANLAPVIRELEKRKHGCVLLYNRRRKKDVTELYGLSADDSFPLCSFERTLSAEDRMKSVGNYASGLTRAWKDLLLFLASDLPSKGLIGLHFFAWSFSQHLFAEACTKILSVSRNMIAMNDYFLWESLYYYSAQSLPLETYILQHGVLSSAYYPPMTKKYLLWGEFEEAQFTGLLGCGPDLCILTGSPRYDGIRDEYLQRKKPLAKRNKIVFLSTIFSFLPEEYRSEYLEVCEWFFRLSVLDESGGYKFIFKAHPFEDVVVYKDLLKKYSSSVSVEGGELFEQLLDARISISHGSTGIYDSIVMETPSIQVVPESLPCSIHLWDWGLTERATSFEEFKHMALGLMTDDLHYLSTVKKISTLSNKAFVNLGHSSEVVADLLEEKGSPVT